MYNLFAEYLQINQIIQDRDSPVIFVTNRFWHDLLFMDWIQSLYPRDNPENLKCKLVIIVYIVADFSQNVSEWFLSRKGFCSVR